MDPHEFEDMEPEWFYDEATGARENLNATAPCVCKRCGAFDIDCRLDEECCGYGASRG